MVALGSSDRLRVAVRGRLLLEDDVGVVRPWQMGMAAWGYGAVLWTAAALSEWRGRSASNAARGDKVATAAGCRARHGLQVEGDAYYVGPQREERKRPTGGSRGD
jgi:hypothetical protein